MPGRVAAAMAPGERCFAYHRSCAPMLWVLIGLALCELALAHLLVALLWSRGVALALSAATVTGIAWLWRAVHSFRRLPVILGPDRILLRAGTIRSITVSRDRVRLRGGGMSAAEARARETLNLALLAHPNVVLDLQEPLRLRRRHVHAIAHRLDDPAAFAAAWGVGA